MISLSNDIQNLRFTSILRFRSKLEASCRIVNQNFKMSAIPIIPTPAVWKLMYVAWSSVLTVPMLFPFVGYMTVDFGMAPNRDAAGYYAGFLAGAFMFGRALSSTCWGVLGDKYGPVKVMYLCTLLSGLLTIYFGMAPNYHVAVVVRVLTGFFNPIIAMIKSIVPQLVPKEHMHAAMSIISVQWAFGLTTGPILGGWLSRWCCGEHKYLLPCLLCGCLQLAGLYPLYLIADEINGSRSPGQPKKRGKHIALATDEKSAEEDGTKIIVSHESDSSDDEKFLNNLVAEARELELVQYGAKENNFSGSSSSSSPTINIADLTGDLDTNRRNDKEVNETPNVARELFKSSPSPQPSYLKKNALAEQESANVIGKKSGASEELVKEPRGDTAGAVESYENENADWCWSNTAMQSVLILYVIFSLTSISTEEVFSLWAVSTRESGGLSVNPQFIGSVIAVQGVCSMVFQMFIGPKIVQRWGLINSVQRGMMIAALSIIPIPLMSDLLLAPTEQVFDSTSKTIYVGLFMAALAALRQVGFYLCFTTSFVLLNNSVPSTHLARVNGFAMGVASVSKFAGPALGSPLFAWSITGDHYFPFDKFCYFFFASGLMLVSAIVFPPRVPRRLENQNSETNTE